VFALGHWTAQYIALHHQLGQSANKASEHERHIAASALFSSRIFLIAALALSKCAVILLVRLVFTNSIKRAWIACNVYIVFIIGWAVTSIVVLSTSRWPSSNLDIVSSEHYTNYVRIHLALCLHFRSKGNVLDCLALTKLISPFHNHLLTRADYIRDDV
jgi:hypothetical protein